MKNVSKTASLGSALVLSVCAWLVAPGALASEPAAAPNAEGPVAVNLFLGMDQQTDLNNPDLSEFSLRIQVLRNREVQLDSGYGYQLRSNIERHVGPLQRYRISPFSHVY